MDTDKREALIDSRSSQWHLVNVPPNRQANNTKFLKLRNLRSGVLSFIFYLRTGEEEKRTRSILLLPLLLK